MDACTAFIFAEYFPRKIGPCIYKKSAWIFQIWPQLIITGKDINFVIMRVIQYWHLQKRSGN